MRARCTLATDVDWMPADGFDTRVVAASDKLKATLVRAGVDPAHVRLYRTDMPDRAPTALAVEGELTLGETA